MESQVESEMSFHRVCSLQRVRNKLQVEAAIVVADPPRLTDLEAI